MSDELISIIVPCYNSEKTILRTLRSIAEQNYTNYEVIIVNDGSSDNSEKVIKEYIRENDKYRYIFQTNKGVSSARNNGIANANGDYIAFVDADDIIDNQFLNILYRSLNKYDVDISCSRYVNVNIDMDHIKNDVQMQGIKCNSVAIIEKYMHKRTEKFSFGSCLYKKSIIIENRIEFPEKLKYGEDSQFIGEYLAHCNRGGYFNECELYGYTIQMDSVMHNNWTWQRTDNITAMENIVKYWKQVGVETPFEEYMIARVIWGIAKDFAGHDRKSLRRLEAEYKVKESMKYMMKYGDEISIRVSSLLYIINPVLFAMICHLYK